MYARLYFPCARSSHTERSLPHALALYSPLFPLQTDRYFLCRCKCPKWIQGTLPDGRYLRKSVKTRSWEKAETLCRRLEDESDPNKPEARARARIVEAIATFRKDEDSRGLTVGTAKKSRYFFETQLKGWAQAEGIVFLDQLTPPLLTKFRSGWGNAPRPYSANMRD